MKAPFSNHVIPSKYKFFSKFSSVHSMLISHDIHNLLIFCVDLHNRFFSLILYFFIVFFSFLYSIPSCTFACLYFSYFESYPFMHLVLTVLEYVSLWTHEPAQCKGKQECRPNQEIILDNSLRDRR